MYALKINGARGLACLPCHLRLIRSKWREKTKGRDVDHGMHIITTLITGYETVGDHTEFIIQVWNKKQWKRSQLSTVYASNIHLVQASCAGIVWLISRRFSDFDQLHLRLQQRYGSKMTCELPEKQWFGRQVVCVCTCDSDDFKCASSNPSNPSDHPSILDGRRTMAERKSVDGVLNQAHTYTRTPFSLIRLEGKMMDHRPYRMVWSKWSSNHLI